MTSIGENYFAKSHPVLELYVKEKPRKFSYATETYDEYVPSSDSVSRKGKTFPSILYILTVSTTTHLAKAFFYGISKDLFSKTCHFRANIFCYVRDLEEALGYFLLLKDLKWGMYHIEKSQFNKRCYEIFSTNTPISLPTTKDEFNALTYKVLLAIIPRLPDTSLQHLPDLFFQESPFLTPILDHFKTRLSHVFPCGNDAETSESNRKAALLTADQVAQIVPFLERSCKLQFTPKQLVNAKLMPN